MAKQVTDQDLNAALPIEEKEPEKASTETTPVSETPSETPAPETPPAETPAPGTEKPKTETPEPTPKVEEPPKAEEPPKPTETPKPERDDDGLTPAERSRLGRRVANIETNIDTKFNILMEKMNTLAGNPDRTINTGEPETPTEIPQTREELNKYLDQRDKARVSDKTNYEVEFMRETDTLGLGVSESEHKEIMDILVKNSEINRMVTKVGQIDAQIAYNKAMAVHYKKKAANPTERPNPLPGNPAKAPIGVNSGGTNTEKKVPAIQFDEHARDFLNYTKMTDEKASEVVKKSKFPVGAKPAFNK